MDWTLPVTEACSSAYDFEHFFNQPAREYMSLETFNAKDMRYLRYPGGWSPQRQCSLQEVRHEVDPIFEYN